MFIWGQGFFSCCSLTHTKRKKARESRVFCMRNFWKKKQKTANEIPGNTCLTHKAACKIWSCFDDVQFCQNSLGPLSSFSSFQLLFFYEFTIGRIYNIPAYCFLFLVIKRMYKIGKKLLKYAYFKLTWISLNNLFVQYSSFVIQDCNHHDHQNQHQWRLRHQSYSYSKKVYK